MAKAPQKPKQPKNGGFKLPPFMTFDPSIDAQRRAQQRGLKDILKDTKRAKNYAGQDEGQKVADINQTQARGTQDIATRGAEIGLRQQRGTEDFSTQLGNLIRDFQVRGSQQTQSANAAGSLDPSTQAAAAGRRQENFNVARHPIDVGQQRLDQDSSLAMQGLGVAQQRLGEDTSRSLGLAGQDYGRTLTDILTKRHRAVREERIGNLDLIQQAIFNARQNKPGAFTQYGSPKQPKAPKPRR